MLRIVGVILVAGCLTGCATIPDVTYNYYPAKWNTTLTVTQTVGCNAAKTEAVVLNAVSVATTYSSKIEKDKAPFKIRIKDLDKFSADVDMTMTFTDDGRLKSINQSATGQGEAIIKSAVSLVGSLAAMPQVALYEMAKKEQEPSLAQCDDIDKWGDKKPITLIFKASVNSDKLGKEVDFKAAPESDKLYEKLRNVLPILKVNVAEAKDITDIKSGPRYENGAKEDVVLLELQKIGSVSLAISSSDNSSDAAKSIGSSRITIPLEATYKLPIPKAALFGKQTFSITLSDAGAVTSIGYGKNAGMASTLNALGSIATTETASTESANIKAQSDLIAQQQRWVLCSTKPKECK